MSTLQFPANPVVGDTYDWDAYKYVWDGEKWKTVGIGSLGSEFPVKGRTPSRLLMAGEGTKQIGYLLGYTACPTDGTEFTAVAPLRLGFFL